MSMKGHDTPCLRSMSYGVLICPDQVGKFIGKCHHLVGQDDCGSVLSSELWKDCTHGGDSSWLEDYHKWQNRR